MNGMTNVLVGQYFHVLRDNQIEKQGQVVALVQRGSDGLFTQTSTLYLVQYLSFIDGSPTYSQVVTADSFVARYRFYATSEAMRAAYEQQAAPSKEH